MRKLISFLLCAIFFPACYFLLLDYVRPVLEHKASRLTWWIVLGTFLTALFVFQFGADTLKRPRFFALGFLLLCGTVYSYDPSLNPSLALVGLKWFWLLPLFGLFAWLYAYSRIERRREPPVPTKGSQRSLSS
jgi:hypothetical protein